VFSVRNKRNDPRCSPTVGVRHSTYNISLTPCGCYPVYDGLGTRRLFKSGLFGHTAPSAPFPTLTIMFSSPLRASFVALVASAVAISAAPALTSNVDLTVTLSLLDLKDDGPGNMKVVTTIVNTGNKTLKLLKDPRGILDSFPDDTFTVTDPTGSHPPFIGAKVNHASGHLTTVRTDACGSRP